MSSWSPGGSCDRCVDGEAVLLGHRDEDAGIPGRHGAGAGPGGDGPLADGEGAVGDDEFGVDFEARPDAGALAARAVGAIEAEGARLDLGEADGPVLGAGGELGEDVVFALALGRDGGDDDDALAELERGLDAVGEAGAEVGVAFADGEPVDDGLDVVPLLLVEDDLAGEVADLTVHPGAGVAALAEGVEDAEVLAFLVADDGGKDHEARPIGEAEHGVGDLLHRLALDGASAAGAVGLADSGEEQAEVVVDLGDGAHDGAGIVGDALLVDGDRGAQPLDVIDVGLLHAAEELAGVGGEGLDVTALALGVDGVEGQRALPRTRQPGDDHQLVAGDRDVDVLEVMLARAFDEDFVLGHRSSSRGRLRSGRGASHCSADAAGSEGGGVAPALSQSLPKETLA